MLLLGVDYHYFWKWRFHDIQGIITLGHRVQGTITGAFGQSYRWSFAGSWLADGEVMGSCCL